MSFGKCICCEVPLLNRGGYAGTDLCGPCCTGEADTVSDVTVKCKSCGNWFTPQWRQLKPGDTCPVCAKKKA